MTTGADWDLREKAELAEQAIAGCFYESDFEVIEQQCCYDSAIFEPAWCRFFEDDSDPSNPRPRAERVYPWDIIYSEEESVAGKQGAGPDEILPGQLPDGAPALGSAQ